MPSTMHLELIETWKNRLGISHWNIACQEIDEMQVTDIWFDNSSGHEFVGIEIHAEDNSAILYHTRPILEDDIIHELLHVRYSEWSEQKVEVWTNVLSGFPIDTSASSLELFCQQVRGFSH